MEHSDFAAFLKKPYLLRKLYGFFELTRAFHNDNFADFITGTRDRRKEYVYGLAFLATGMVLLFFSWSAILVFLKCKGKSVGCASGHAFQTKQKESDSTIQGRTSAGGSSEEDYDSTLQSGSREQSERSDHELFDLPEEDELSPKQIARNKRRASRTRSVFLLFWLISLVSVVLLMVFSFARVKESMNASDKLYSVRYTR